MNTQKIRLLFTLFSGEKNSPETEPLLQGAMLEVEGRLRPGADKSDERLDYLAAAIANLRHTELLATRDRLVYTAAGSAPTHDSGKNRPFFAATLMKAYLDTAQPLLCDDAFAFCAVRERGEADA